jgi:ABC-type transport system substrate-binding protein
LLGIGFGIAIFFLLKFLLPLFDVGQNVRIGKTGRYTVSTLPIEILKLAGNGLTRMEDDGSVVPDLASSWETTDKGKTWIFTLKENLFWQDGNSLTSKDISYQFSDVSIERPDDMTIVFKLQNAYSAFPAVVSRPTFKSGFLGTGKWKVTDISLNGSVVEQIDLLSEDDIKTTYKFYPTEERTKIAFELGQVDRIEDVFNLKPFDTWTKTKINKVVNAGQYVAIFFNTQDGYLSEKNLRQALSYAINKDELYSERAISPISKTSWVYNSQVKAYDYDPIKAKETVDEYKKSTGIDNLAINLSTSSLLLNQAEIIANSWKAIGIDVNLQVVSARPNEYQAFLAIYDVPDDPDQYSIWHSTQTATNITHYQNVRIDKLLEDGRSELNMESRKKIYLDFQRFLVEDSPAAFLYYPTTYTISRR